MTKLRASVAVVGLLMGLVLVPLSTAQASPQKEYAAAAFGATNHQRVDRDLKALRQSDCLQKFADTKAKQLARAQDHSLPHQPLGPIQRDCDLSSAGENLAYGFASGESVVNDGWMHSAGHRANILRASYRLMAIGARQATDGTWYVSQVFGKKR